MEKTLLMYGTYKTEELDEIRKNFEKADAEFTLSSHLTNRGLPFHVIEGKVTPEQQKQIRDAIHEIAKKNYHWGKMTFERTVW